MTFHSTSIYFYNYLVILYFSFSHHSDIKGKEKKIAPPQNVSSSIQIHTVNHLTYQKIAKHILYFIKLIQMSDKRISSFHTLPIELVYRILDNVDEKTLFISCRGVCKRLNDILDTYKPYQVIINFIMYTNIFIIIRTNHFLRKICMFFISFTDYIFEETNFMQQYLTVKHIL